MVDYTNIYIYVENLFLSDINLIIIVQRESNWWWAAKFERQMVFERFQMFLLGYLCLIGCHCIMYIMSVTYLSQAILKGHRTCNIEF